MFIKPGSDEDALFDLLEEGETDTEAENPTPFGKEFGSQYASPQTAAQRMTPAQPPISTPKAGYNDLNSRPVSISERTFMPPPKSSARSKAANAMLQKGK